LASLGVSLEGRSSSQGDSVDLELRHCVSEGTLSELDLAHVCKCALGRQQIQGYPHAVPEKAIDKLPAFQGNNAISARSHIVNFEMCVQKYCRGHDEEDVKMILFVYSLEVDALEWFTDFPAAKFSTLDEILDEFKKRWGDQKEHRFQLAALTTIQKKENETVVEFNTKFNNLVKSLHRDIKPSDAAT
jgi:hypothetical protein